MALLRLWSGRGYAGTPLHSKGFYGFVPAPKGPSCPFGTIHLVTPKSVEADRSLGPEPQGVQHSRRPLPGLGADFYSAYVREEP